MKRSFDVCESGGPWRSFKGSSSKVGESKARMRGLRLGGEEVETEMKTREIGK